MADLDPEALAEHALRSLHGGDPREARKLLFDAVQAAPHRADLLNALGVVHLELGEPELARPLIQQAVQLVTEQLADPQRRGAAETMIDAFLLGLAAACEDLDEPAGARDAYRRVLTRTVGQPRARMSLAHLLLGLGEVDEGLRELRLYLEEDRDENPFLDGARQLADQLDQFRKRAIHPREFLIAHRESYVEFFDEQAAEQESKGWIAEAARMKRAPDGRVVPLLAEGARPYAAVRVDLVNPHTSEIGQVGDQPMVVALAEYPTLARGPIAIEVLHAPVRLFISSQAPWDQLPIHVLFERGGAVDALDGLVGDWYSDGWNGAFGTREGGRMHYISDLEVKRDGRGVTFHVDMGRARIDAIDDLLRRLEGLHSTHRIERILLGRGWLPEA